MPSTRRLPGIAFETRLPPLDETLPRMDVAAFVGFAASGPLHVPVAVEDLKQFAAIFGGDVTIGWDEARRAVVRAHLAPAVRAFFAHGGRRCWIVRVGDGLVTNRFPVPGVVHCSFDGAGGARLTPAFAKARSPGSWSDRFETGTALSQAPIVVLQVTVAEGVTEDGADARQLATLDLTLEAAAEPGAGDLLRLPADDGVTTWFAPITAVSRDGTARSAAASRRRFHVQTGRVVAVAAGAVVAVRVLDSAVPSGRRGALLRFDLFVRDRGALVAHLPDLGFARGHPRDWRRLPDDLELFLPRRADAPELSDLAASARDLRFPLAGELLDRTDPPDRTNLTESATLGDDPGFDLPMDMGPIAERFLGCGADAATRLERDGLAGLSAAAFLDPRLTGLGLATLSARVNELQTDVRAPRLRGIHALLPLAEVTLVAVPDAVHPPWTLEVDARDVPSAPPAASAAPPADRFHDCAPPAPPTLPGTGEGTPGTDLVPHARFRLPAAGALHWETLVAVDRELLRICAARGDLFAVLSLPLRTRAEEAIALADLLCSASAPTVAVTFDLDSSLDLDEGLGARHVPVAPIRGSERRALTFGAIHHPWLIERTALQVEPPEPPAGAVVGQLARTALRAGAWIAAANAPLAGVIALAEELPSARWLDLQAARINFVRSSSEGFLVLAADTLADEEDVELRSIPVRRLMSLLRRLALQHGATYVFEPNGAPLRRAVRQGFEALLETLFLRGAFAGGTRSQAFRVSVTGVENAAREVEQGQLVVELRVAPAEPLRFLTLRLLQLDGRGLQLQELQGLQGRES